MSYRDDFYSKEATLINRSKRELADGTEKDSIYKLRLLCFARGATGILGLARALRGMQQDDGKSLHFAAFNEGIHQTGLECNEDEIKKMFDLFDVDNKGSININKFLAKLRPPLTPSRLNVIDKAFEKVDSTGKGVISVKELKNVYNVKDHPKYLSGELTEKEILNQFLSHFDGKSGKLNSKISKDEFVNYYSTVSASIDNDAYFDLLMRRAYKL